MAFNLLPKTYETPINNSRRYLSIDVIRGFAVIGIFLVNIQNFVAVAGQHPIAQTTFDETVYAIVALVALGKFHFIFSFLFGATTNIFLSRLKANKQGKWRYFRRMAIFLLLGAVHSYFWGGDTILAYAVAGICLFPLFDKCSKKLMLVIGLLFIFVVEAYQFIYHPINYYLFTEELPFFSTDKLFFIIQTAGQMLFGFVAYEIGLFTRKEDIPFIKKITLVLFVLSIGVWTLSFFTMADNINSTLYFAFIPGMFYVALIKLIFAYKSDKPFFQKLQPFGKMALSNYLIQTIVGITLVPLLVDWRYLSSLEVFSICILTFTIQLTFANLWLKYFYYGPVEWIWRCVTYLSKQPLRRK